VESMCDPTRASTSHAAGIQVGMADGSVRVLAPTTLPKVWWAFCTPAGNEAVSADN
jgi:hypothetical protein